MTYQTLDERIEEAKRVLTRLEAEKRSRDETNWKVFIFQREPGNDNYGLAVSIARTAEEARELIAKEAHRVTLDVDISELSLTVYYSVDNGFGKIYPLAYIRLGDEAYLPF